MFYKTLYGRRACNFLIVPKLYQVPYYVWKWLSRTIVPAADLVP